MAQQQKETRQVKLDKLEVGGKLPLLRGAAMHHEALFRSLLPKTFEHVRNKYGKDYIVRLS